MRQRIAWVLTALGVTSAAAADPPIAGDRPACVSVRASSFAAVEGGWNHLVWVQNRCAQQQVCLVRTNANPGPLEVRVAPGREEMVNTFLHSPAQGFVPRVDCPTERSGGPARAN